MDYKGFRLEILSTDLFKGYAYSYILETKNNIFIIDASIESAKGELDNILSTFSITTKPISLLITHGHWDHVGLAYYIKEKYKATIYANIDSKELMASKDAQLHELYDRYAPTYSFKDSIEKVWEKDFINTISPDKYIKDGDEFLDDGFTLKVISTKGHSKDELSFLNIENNIIFTGDTIQGSGYNNHPPIYENKDYLLYSLHLLEEIKPNSIFGGHVLVKEKDMVNKFINESIEYVHKLDNYLNKNELEFDDLLHKFNKDFGYENAIHSIMTLKAHFSKK